MIRLCDALYRMEVATDPECITDSPRLGIEVEFENAPAPDFLDWAQNLWRWTDDGSLRNNGSEYVTPPLSIEDAKCAVDILWHAKEQNGWLGTPRTGIHVHVNCLTYTLDQIITILAVYAVMEPFMFAIAGGEREENVFCIPWYRGNMPLSDIRDALSSRELWVLRDTNKYSALNVRPLVSYGTLEFRHAPTWDDVNTVHTWVDAVMGLVQYGASCNLAEFMERAEAGNVRPLAEEVFGELWPEVARVAPRVDDDTYYGLGVLGVASALYVQSDKAGYEWLYQIATNPRPPSYYSLRGRSVAGMYEDSLLSGLAHGAAIIDDTIDEYHDEEEYEPEPEDYE